MKWKVAAIAVMLLAASFFSVAVSAPVMAAKDDKPNPDPVFPDPPIVTCGDPVPGGPGGGGDN